MNKEDYRKLVELIDNNASTLVGILAKRLEVFDRESLSPIQIKRLFKSIAKESIYESSRQLKRLIEAKFNIVHLRIDFRKPKENDLG